MPSVEYLLHVAEPIPVDIDKVPIVELVRYRLGRKIARRWRKDLKSGIAPPLPPSHLEKEELPAAEKYFIEAAISRLFSAWHWRLTLIEPSSIGNKVPVRDTEEFAPAFARALEVLLGPWLRGKAELNYDHFYRLNGWLPTIEKPVDDIERYGGTGHGKAQVKRPTNG